MFDNFDLTNTGFFDNAGMDSLYTGGIFDVVYGNDDDEQVSRKQ